MLHIKAQIELYKGSEFRQTPFYNGYRPLFNFISEMKKSGQITLLDKSQFQPGEKGLVEIAFLDDKYLGNDFGKGKKFTFGEGSHLLGEGQVLEIE